MRTLDSLTIHSFRGLQNLELKDFGQVNILVGENNAGKTSVLEAISLYCQPFNQAEWIETSRRREVSGKTYRRISILSSLSLLFPQCTENDGISHGNISIQAEGNFEITSLIVAYQDIQGVPDEKTMTLLSRRFPNQPPQDSYNGAELQITAIKNSVQIPLQFMGDGCGEDNKTFIFWEGMPLLFERHRGQDTLPIKIITPISHRTDYISDYSNAILSGKNEDIIKLAQLFDENISNILVLSPNDAELYVEHKKSGMLPLTAFGDGLRRVVLMASILPSVANGILLIDEIETAIHISVLNKIYAWLFEACRQYNIQLFATTHSLEAVDALLTTQTDSTAEDLVVYRLGESGKPATRFSMDLLNRLRMKRGLDVR